MSATLLPLLLSLAAPPGGAPAAEIGLRVESRLALAGSVPGGSSEQPLGVARLGELRLSVLGTPGQRVFVGLAPRADGPAAAQALGTAGLVWLVDGSRDGGARIGDDGQFAVELWVPEGLPIGTRMTVQALTLDEHTGALERSAALELAVEDTRRTAFVGAAAEAGRAANGWTALRGEVAHGTGLLLGAGSLVVRSLSGLEAGLDYRVDLLLEVAAAGPQADPAVLWAGAASRLPEPAESAPALGEGDANAPLTLLSGQPPTAFSRRWVARGLAVRADPSGRAWLLLYGPAEGRAELLSAEITVRR